MASLKDYFLATRPAFLITTLLACLIGLLSTRELGATDPLIYLLTIVLALLVHASANLLNDYFDHLKGSDSINADRISPFTGGSRYIQNQILTSRQVYGLGLSLLLIACVLGIYLCMQSTWILMTIGLLGIVIAWAYSAPPLQLMSRGIFGEMAIALAWSLVVIGFATLQTRSVEVDSFPLAMSYGLMVSNILFVNQIPDIRADRSAGKYTLAVQSSNKALWIWYAAIVMSAYLFQFIAVLFSSVSPKTLLTLLLLPAFGKYAWQLHQAPLPKERLKTLIVRNMTAVHLYAVLLCIGLY